MTQVRFLGIAGSLMRQILIDHARARNLTRRLRLERTPERKRIRCSHKPSYPLAIWLALPRPPVKRFVKRLRCLPSRAVTALC